jgi:hypothetical protein
MYDLIANGKRKFAKSTIYRAIAKGNAGKSPLKKCPPPIVPSFLVETAAAGLCRSVSGGKRRRAEGCSGAVSGHGNG